MSFDYSQDVGMETLVITRDDDSELMIVSIFTIELRDMLRNSGQSIELQ